MSNRKAKDVLASYITVTPLEGPDQFGIVLPSGEGLLRTPAGTVVQSASYRLMLHTVRELEQYPVLKVEDGVIVEPRWLCSYLIFSTQQDFVVANTQVEREEVERALRSDPVLHPVRAR